MVTLTLSLLFPIVLVAFIIYLTPWLSGWRSLAEKYRAEGHFSGLAHTFWYAHMRSMTKYNRVLKVGCDERGLSLSTAFYFRLGHPPLFIPWSEVHFIRRQAKIFSYQWPVIRIFFKDCPDVYLDLTEKVLTETEWAQYAKEISPGEAPEVQNGKEILRMILFVVMTLGSIAFFFYFFIPRSR